MILRMHQMFDYLCYFNAWLFVGMLTVIFKSHPWHGRMPAFDVFYDRYKDDTMIRLYIRICTLTMFWVLLLGIAMLISF
jgi:hypothetical protein